MIHEKVNALRVMIDDDWTKSLLLGCDNLMSDKERFILLRFMTFWHDGRSTGKVKDIAMMKQIVMIGALVVLSFSASAKDECHDSLERNESTQTLKQQRQVEQMSNEHASDADDSCKKKHTHRSRTSLTRGHSPFTRVYSVQDLESTGQTDTLQALRHLDPSIF